ncbi:MAG: histidine kinase [Flavobacteriaceae bacterium]|nr:histidine kinase [Bacteroidia bacterium]NNF74682.1 histidine kinase [Flavobacteriaceae bacterium]
MLRLLIIIELVILTILSGPNSWAQVNLDNHVSFEATDELQNHKIIEVAEDDLGFIFIATNKQVFRFDGLSLFPMFSGLFVEILKDEKNSCLYFIHRRGIYKYNWVTNVTEHIKIGNVNNVVGNVLSAIFKNDKSMLLGYDNGFITFNTEDFTYSFSPVKSKLGTNTTFLSLHLDERDSTKIWMGSRKAGLFKYDLIERTYKQDVFTNSPKELIDPSNTITEIYQNDNHLFLGTWYGGVLKYNVDDGKYSQFFVENFKDGKIEKARDHVHKIVPFGKDKIYFSSTAGAMLYDLKADRELSRFNAEDGIPTFSNAPQFVDSRNRLWIGREQGIRLIDTLRTNVEVLKNPFVDNQGWYIPRKSLFSEDGNTILFCTFYGQGLYIYERLTKAWKFVPPDIPTSYQQFKAIDLIIDQNGAFVLEESALYRYKNGAETLTKVNLDYEDLKGSFLKMIKLGESRFIALIRSNGLFEIDIDSGEVNPFMTELYELFPEISGYSGDELHLDENGNIWMGWKNHLLVKMTDGQIVNLSPHLNNGEPILNINDITESKGFVYVALPSGVYKLDAKQLPDVNVKKISDKDYGVMAVDQVQNLWLLRDGLFNLGAGDTEEVEFGINDGLHDPGRYGYEYVNPLGDKIIVGSRGQFSIIDPQSIQKNNEIPIPYINKISANGLELKADSSFYVLKNIDLKSNENNLTIEFSALAFTKPESIKFRYRLNGIDEQWNLANTNQSNVTYSNLDGGKYDFILEASNSNLLWSDPKTLKLNIAIPFYKNKWFLSLVLLLGVYLIYSQYRRRLIKLKKEAQVSEQLLTLERQALRAQMNPHFVFNALNSIQHLITEGEEQKSILFLNKFSKLLRGILDNSQSAKATLSHELEILKNYLELEFLRLGNQFTYELIVPESLYDERIEMQGLLFQPFIENAIHHGLAPKRGKGHLKVEFENHENFIRCIIQDDGIGRDKASHIAAKRHHKSRGIGIVEKRIKLMSTTHNQDAIKIIDLFSGSGEPAGTRVELKIPINGTT